MWGSVCTTFSAFILRYISITKIIFVNLAFKRSIPNAYSIYSWVLKKDMSLVATITLVWTNKVLTDPMSLCTFVTNTHQQIYTCKLSQTFHVAWFSCISVLTQKPSDFLVGFVGFVHTYIFVYLRVCKLVHFKPTSAKISKNYS